MVMVTLVDLIYIYQIYVQIFVNYINWFSSQGKPTTFFHQSILQMPLSFFKIYFQISYSYQLHF